MAQKVVGSSLERYYIFSFIPKKDGYQTATVFFVMRFQSVFQ